MAQVSWMVHYLADIESDMSAIHRVDDIWSMPGPRFFRLAWRLPAYRGVVRERVLAEERQNGQTGSARAMQQSYAPQADSKRRVVLATRAVLESDPAFAGIFSFDTASGS